MEQFVIGNKYEITTSNKTVRGTKYLGSKQITFIGKYTGTENNSLVFELEEGHEKIIPVENIIRYKTT